MNKGRKTSILMAAGIAVLVTVWMLSGLGSSPADFGNIATISNADGDLMRVRIEQIRASRVDREIVLSARTEPNRYVQLKAETDGAVVRLLAERGQAVTSGQPVLELDMRDRNARLVQAQALVDQRQLEFNATENLRDRQFSTQVQIAQARALLESARADVERIGLEIANTSIEAPFDGVVQDRPVEIGDYVRAGDVVLDFVDLDPLIVAGEVNGAEVTELTLGSTGSVVLADGRHIQGTIRYLAPVADQNTRTFRVELAVENPDNGIRAGLSAELRLSGNSLLAHDISPGILTLADDGSVGVKTVDADNVVGFYPVEIVGSSEQGILVTGLPDAIRVITVGQGFITVGQTVVPVQVSPFDGTRPAAEGSASP